MSSRLKAVAPKAAAPSKPKVLIFGKPGTGKTWASLDWPSVYYIDTEGGANLPHYTDKLHKAGGVYLGPEQGSLSFDTIIEQVQALATEQHPFRTLVIDSVSKLYNSAAFEAAEKIGDEFGRDKKEANKPLRRLINWLNRLPLNVILIAHEKPLWGLNNRGERAEIGTTADIYEKLEYELHLCLNIVRQGDKRVARVRKSRLLGFPDGATFEWSYASFAERYGRDIIEEQAAPLVLASPEQLEEVRQLLEVVRVPENQIDKWFTAAGVSSFEEMDADKVAKVITWLKDKVTPASRPVEAPQRAAAANIRPIRRSAKP
jgi:hypothetical protein